MDLRQEYEAAEARGLPLPPADKPKRGATERRAPSDRRAQPDASVRMRVVWAVCDIGGRTVATFDYVCKADAEAHALALKAKGKGPHFVRSVKEPMTSG